MEKFLGNVVVASFMGAKRMNPFGNDRANPIGCVADRQPMRRKMAATALGPQLVNIYPTTPEAFGIVGGESYLNYSK